MWKDTPGPHGYTAQHAAVLAPPHPSHPPDPGLGDPPAPPPLVAVVAEPPPAPTVVTGFWAVPASFMFAGSVPPSGSGMGAWPHAMTAGLVLLRSGIPNPPHPPAPVVDVALVVTLAPVVAVESPDVVVATEPEQAAARARSRRGNTRISVPPKGPGQTITFPSGGVY